MPFTVPNLMTLGRILVIPVIVGLCFVPGPEARWAAVGCFILAALTDLLDGYLARRWQQTSDFGRFLDPIADKLLVAALLLSLAATGDITDWSLIPALLILSREIFISGLREFMGGHNIVVPVSLLAKWKTTLQLIALTFLLFGNAGPSLLPLLGDICLWIASLLTLITGYDYFKAALPVLGFQKSAAAQSEADKRAEASSARS